MYKYNDTPNWIARLWDAQALRKTPVPLYWAMVTCTLVFSAFALTHHSDVRFVALLTYLMGILVLARYAGPLRKGAPVWFLLGGLLIPVVSWYFMRVDFPGYQYANNPYPDNLLDKFVFLLPALILAGSARNVMVFWLVGLVAVLMLPWTSGDGLAEWQHAIQGRRAGFGINPIRAGMMTGTIFLGSLVFYRRWVYRPGFSFWRFSAWLLLTLLSGFMTVATQTRSVYLAMALIAVGGLMIGVFIMARRRALLPGIKSWVAVGAIAVLGITMLLRSEVFGDLVIKTERQLGAVAPFLQGDFDNIPDNSVGLRLQFWVDGAQWISERPVVGWGYRASRMVHQEAGNMFGDRYFRSLHNGFVDLQLTYGLMGSTLMGAFLVWLLWHLHAAWRSKVLPSDYYLFILLFLTFYGINSLFTSAWFISDSIYLWNVVLTGAVAFVYRQILQSSKPGDSETQKPSRLMKEHSQ